MNRRWSVLIIILFGILIVYELFNQRLSLLLIIIGLVSLYLRNHFSDKRRNSLLLITFFSFSLALFTSRLFLALLIILVLLFIGNHSTIYTLIREAFLESKSRKSVNDFIMVNFAEETVTPAKISRNKWLGDNQDTIKQIYSWEDINYTKIIGDTVFDLGNTLLPKEHNVILIRKALGDTKVIVPEGIAVSLDISLLTGNVKIKEEEYPMLNETFKWHSENYQISERKIKIVANILLGEVEVIFL